jgi:hypothetical protein
VIAALARRFDSGANPIALKELRQAVRGRFIAAMLVLSLIAFLLAMMLFVINQSLQTTTMEQVAAGPAAFATTFMVLFTVCMFFVPLYTGLRMMAERSDTNIDLLFITSLSPRSIVLGKLQSAVAVIALMFFAALPFFMFCYVLRGIDFVSILVISATGMFLIVSQSIVALFVGCLPASKPFKLLLAIVLFAMTMMTYAPMAILTRELMMPGGFAGVSGAYLWRSAALVAALLPAADIMLLVASTALLAPTTANRAMPIRIMLTILWAVTVAIAAYSSARTNVLFPLNGWGTVWIGLFSLVLFSAVGERESWGRRLARTIPVANPMRSVAFVFYSGSGGVLFAIGGMIATVLAYDLFALGVTPTEGTAAPQFFRWLIDAALCMTAYACSALLIRRKLLANRILPKGTWAIALVLFILLAIVPPIVSLIFDAEQPGFTRVMEIATLANPFPITQTQDPRIFRLVFLALWCGIAMAANARWLIDVYRGFRHPADAEPA